MLDAREDVPALPDSSVDAICAILAAEGVRFKVSSIHVNFWWGDFDKLSMADLLLRDLAGTGVAGLGDRACFIGDSPNDEPLFAGFPFSIAVGNLRAFAARLAHLPRYITGADCAEGFCEAARLILGRRAALPGG